MTVLFPPSSQKKELEILNFLRPHLKDRPPTTEEGYWTPPPGLIPDLTKILTEGHEWLSQDAKKKEIAQFRKLLQKTRDCRDRSRTLHQRFPSYRDFPESTTPLRHEADTLFSMIEECDKILGTREPKRYPRRSTIKAALTLWKKYTGKTPPKNAHAPSMHSEIRKETAPFTFCRMILAAIEDCTDVGDFSGTYEGVLKTLD